MIRSFKKKKNEDNFGKILIFILSVFLSSIFFFKRGYSQGAKKPPERVEVKSVFLDANKLFEISNEWRISQGLRPYTKLKRLCDSAKIRNIEIQTNWSHEGFSAARFCYNQWCEIAENLSKNKSSEEENTFQAWLKSPTHLENLKADYKYSCVSTSEKYAVQHFGNF